MGKLDIRILQLDLARQIETVEFVKSYADFAKECGYNYLLLYLEASIRTTSTSFFDKDCTYSIEEMKEIVSYAESIGLKVIPCFENLPHLEKFFRYEKLASLSELYDENTVSREYRSYKYGSEGCPSNPELYSFLDNYFEECMQCFENSEYVHMGLDEVFDLAHCEKCKKRLDNGENKADIFYKHVMHTYNLVKSWGKTMMMWDDFFEFVDISSRLPRDIIMVNWNYDYVGAEPGGHWIGKRKRDWFRWYDKLGFNYIFGVYAHRGSSTMNTDTFTAYAEKYSPIGAITTTWERSASFYQGAYAFIYYSARKWLGEINSQEDRINAFAYIFDGNKDLAELLLSNYIGSCGGGLDMLDRVENANQNSTNWLSNNEYFLKQLKAYITKLNGRAKDVLIDIYSHALENYVISSFNDLGNRIFDAYETDGITDKFVMEVQDAEKKILEISQNAKYLWRKYRKGIKSFNNDFENKWKSYQSKFEEIIKRLKENKKWGTFTGEFMLHDRYGTPRTKITLNYADGTKKTIVNGQIKPTLGSACFSVRFRIDNKPIQSVELSAYGEGATYPSYFYYIVDGKKYVVSSVEKVCGNCQRIEKLIENDSGFAILGVEDALKCFNDVDCTKQLHTIIIKFKEL